MNCLLTVLLLVLEKTAEKVHERERENVHERGRERERFIDNQEMTESL